MSSTQHSLAIGPVRCAWFPYQRGTPAEPQARRWLAQALATPEAALGLHRDAHGRPQLVSPVAAHDANWSHSGEQLLVALAQGARVGADIEWLRPRPNAMTLARRFFTAGEADALAALPHDQAERWFVRLWCAKEAVLKAHGRGIAFGLHRFRVGERDGAMRLLQADPALGPEHAWSLHEFEPLPGYHAALAWRPRS